MKLFKFILLCLFLSSAAKADTIYQLIKIPNLEIYNIKTENKLRYLYAKQPFTIGINNNINSWPLLRIHFGLNHFSNKLTI